MNIYFNFDNRLNKKSLDKINKKTKYLVLPSTNCIKWYGTISLSRFTELIEFSCTENNINQIKYLPSTLKKLDCSSNEINEFDPTDLPDSLEILNCSNNYLNNLDNLPPTLKELNCSINQIEMLEYLPAGLEVLDCEENCLKDMNNFPGGLISINISENELKSIDFGSLNFTNLKTFICESNQITWINFKPSNGSNFIGNYVMEAGSLKKLRYLDISNNLIRNLDYLPDNLVKLNCSKNKITQLINLPKTLKYLICSDNPIKKIKFSNIKKLYSLECSNNYLKSLKNIPKNISSIYCDFVLIKTIEKALGNLNVLRTNNKVLKEKTDIKKKLLIKNNYKPVSDEVVESEFQKSIKLKFTQFDIVDYYETIEHINIISSNCVVFS